MISTPKQALKNFVQISLPLTEGKKNIFTKYYVIKKQLPNINVADFSQRGKKTFCLMEPVTSCSDTEKNKQLL